MPLRGFFAHSLSLFLFSFAVAHPLQPLMAQFCPVLEPIAGSVDFFDQAEEQRVKALIEELRSSEYDRTQEIVKELKATPEYSIPALTQVMRTETSSVILSRSAMILSEMGKRSLPALIELTDPAMPSETRVKAIWAMGQMGGQASTAVAHLKNRALVDQDREVRMQTATTLGQIGAKAESAIPALMAINSGNDNELKSRALYSLGGIRRQPELVVPFLIEATTHPNVSVRDAAARALGEFGVEAEAALPALKKLAQADPDADVQADAQMAYNKITERLAQRKQGLRPQALPFE
jgi:HEAT repeat protein